MSVSNRINNCCDMVDFVAQRTTLFRWSLHYSEPIVNFEEQSPELTRTSRYVQTKVSPSRPAPAIGATTTALTVALCVALPFIGCTNASTAQVVAGTSSYDDLTSFFHEWRALAAPDYADGVPNYSTKAMSAQHRGLRKHLTRLETFDTSSWTVPQKVDMEVIRAEMNALDFNHRVLKPWANDPAFYMMIYPNASDTPAREGPTIHNAINPWTYEYPLSDEDAADLVRQFRSVKPLYSAAKSNLNGNGADLWTGGIHSIRQQIGKLQSFKTKADRADVGAAVDQAIEATRSLLLWLEETAPTKTASAGIGKENYNWYLKHVQLVPYTWDDEVAIMKRELARAHAYLKLTEHKNRDLPQLERFSSAEEYDREMDKAVDEFMSFLKDADIVTVEPYMEPEMRKHMGTFVPVEGDELRQFFSEANYRDALVMRTHFYHWLEIARIANDPLKNEIRRSPHLYNIFAGRSEGLATSFEEMMMAAGMFEGRPRAKELIYILLAQRAARALGGLYMHGREMTMEEASLFAAEGTPSTLR